MIRPDRRDEAWSASLRQSFFATCVGGKIILDRKFDIFGDHFSTCTAHSGAKTAHDWAVEQLADLFRTTHRVKTQQVDKSRVQRCGDNELAAYLSNAAGPVPLVLDLRIAHERWESSSNPSLNGYPADIDRTLNEGAADKNLLYRADYNNRSSHAIAFMPAIASTVVYTANLCDF